MNRMSRIYTFAGWLAILYLLVLFLYPLLQVVWTSVWVDEQFTLDTYTAILSKSLYTQVLLETLRIAVISTLIGLIVGYTLALFIVHRPSRQQGFWLLLIVSSMFMSLTIRLFGWLIMLGEAGPLMRIVRLLFGESIENMMLFSSVSVIIGIVHFILPFVVLTIYTTLKKMEPALLEASTMLGASPMRTFWRVTFPLSLPGVYASASITFALASSTFLVPLMLGGPKNQLLANVAYNAIVNIGNMGMGAALSFLLLILIVLVLMIIGVLERRGHHGF